jgi:hypothetical protein
MNGTARRRRSLAGLAAAGAMLVTSLAGMSAASASTSRAGTLDVTKNCSNFTGNPYPASYCVITASNLPAIQLGSKVLYLQPTQLGTPAGSDVILDPGTGTGKAFGNCALDPATGDGACTFNGGTGAFSWFSAKVAVTNLDGVNFTWTGTYAFSPPKSGALKVTKNCAGFTGNPYPQSSCTITASNLRAIPVGTKIFYLEPSQLGTPGGSDVILDPGTSTGKALGNCALNPATGDGACTFSGGTGKFRYFHATVVVTNLDGVNFTWTGTYTFSPPRPRG